MALRFDIQVGSVSGLTDCHHSHHLRRLSDEVVDERSSTSSDVVTEVHKVNVPAEVWAGLLQIGWNLTAAFDGLVVRLPATVYIEAISFQCCDRSSAISANQTGSHPLPCC